MKCPKCGSSRLVDHGKGKKCVDCNFEWQPKKTGCFTWLVAIFVVVFVFPIYIGAIWHNEKEIQNKTLSATSTAQASSSKSAWHRSSEKDEFNGNNNLYFINRSSDSFRGHFNTKHYPVIHVRCKDNITEVAIDFDTTMTCSGSMQVGIKIDDQEPYYEKWNAATNCEALFAPQPIKLLKKIKDHKKMMIKFIPFQKSDINASFDLLGIQDVVVETSQACKWPK